MTSPSIGRRFSNVEGHRTARAPRRGSMPLVSIVVASNRDWQVLQTCLTLVVDECARLRAEIVVARAAVGPDIDTLARMYPSVGFVEGAATASIAQLRSLGMREATGDIVVFLEDVMAIDSGWVDAFVRQGQRESGTVPDIPQRAEIDWAGYLAAYGVAVPGRPEGQTGGAMATPAPAIPPVPGAGRGWTRLRAWLARLARARHRADRP